MTMALPDDLAVLPPGPGLAAALGSLELTEVPNDRMLELLRAQYRQLCHEQARMAAVLAEVGRCSGFPAPGEVHRLATPDRFAAEEIRAALCWTRRAADTEHELADAVISRLPAVFAAWAAGDLDRPRVRVFDHYLTGLTAAQVTEVCRVAVPKARGLTTGQLAVLLRRMVIAVDPTAAERWYRESVRRRGVVAYPAADGTITLSAHGLPTDEAEAACTRLENLAARAQRAGHPGLIDQIRTDLFLGLLDGRYHHLTTEQLVTTLISEYAAAAEPAEPTGPGAAGCTEPDPGGSAGQTKPSTDEPAEQEAASPARPEPTAEPASAEHEASKEPATPEPEAADETADAEYEASEDPAAPDRGCPAQAVAHRADDQRVGIEIRVGLATLLGRDELPAEIPGLGLLPAPDARRRVLAQTRAEWRFALTDDTGRLVFDGITRRRPRGTRDDGPPDGIVELHLPLSLLTKLHADPSAAHPDWTALITDIAAQHASADDQHRDLDAHPKARLPGAALRRHTEIRDRTCTFPGCRHRSHRTHQDHTRDHQHGGTTIRGNLGPLCPHDHRVKHVGGWQVEQPEPGAFTWQSPLGGTYRTTGEPFLAPMPDPVPADLGPERAQVRPDLQSCPILRHWESARPVRRPTRRPPPRAPTDEPPPF